jgi:integrase
MTDLYGIGETACRGISHSGTSFCWAWVGEMTAKGLAPSTVESYYRVLAAVMKAAKRDRLIAVSPTDGITLPRSERNASALVPLTFEQVHAIAGAVPAHYRALVLTSAGLGLRQGEACGLTVDRIDFLRQTVRIDRQLISPSGKGPVVFGPPKTQSSNRVITLSDSVRDGLAAHLARFDSSPDGLVFTSNTEESLRRSVWGGAYKSAAKSVGIESTKHDLRHHCASLLISSSVSIKAVQQFLGRKNASETLDTYGHLMPGDDDRVRSAIDAALSGNVHGMCTPGASAVAE